MSQSRVFPAGSRENGHQIIYFQQIWDMKYRFKADNGTPVDKTMPDTFKRIAVALADPEKDQDHWREVFFKAMSDFKFLPAGQS